MTSPDGAPATISGAELDFPRPGRRGSGTQHLLFTLVSELWGATWLPSRLLARCARLLGVTPSSAQSGLSRLTTRGLLAQRQQGTRSEYRLTPEAEQRMVRGMRQVADFRAARAWDRRWTCVCFSVPEGDRARRDRVRHSLKWRGFGHLPAGMWVSARVGLEEVRRLFAENAVSDYLAVRVDADELVGVDPLTAWDLDELARVYEPFLDAFGSLARDAESGSLAPADAFAANIRVVDAWRASPWQDPDLPDELLPPGHGALAASELFQRLFRATLPGAQSALDDLIAEEAPHLSGRLRVGGLLGRPPGNPQ